MKNIYTIARVTLHDPTDHTEMFALVHADGSAFLVGELAETLDLHAALKTFIDAGAKTDATIDELSDAFGHRWLSTGDACREYQIKPSTMRQWMASSPYAEKRGSKWYAPEIVIRGWVANYTPHAG